MKLPLRWYLTGTALFLIPGGIQIVLFPWLVAVYLHESPTRVGLAQMAAQLPMLLLIYNLNFHLDSENWKEYTPELILT